MSLTPSVNNNFARVSFDNQIVSGEQPKLGQIKLLLSDVLTADKYIMGALLSVTADPSVYKLYDSAAAPAEKFKAVFFDDTVTPDQIAVGFVNIAIKDGNMTLWDKTKLVGVNAGSTDIDYLIANGFANERWVNGKLYVQFGGIGYGQK